MPDPLRALRRLRQFLRFAGRPIGTHSRTGRPLRISLGTAWKLARLRTMTPIEVERHRAEMRRILDELKRGAPIGARPREEVET